MTYKSTKVHEVYRSEPLVLPYLVSKAGTAQDISGWTSITAHLFLATNTPVWTGTLADDDFAYDDDGTDGEITLTVDTDYAPGTYELQIWGLDADSVPEMLAVERVRILFNSHDRS